MLEAIPDPIKRERRRDVIEKGLDSQHFKLAIARMLKLYSDMEACLVEHPWLVGEKYTIADAAFTPSVVRLEHLDILQLLDGHPKVLDWYGRLKERPSFQDAIVKWENPDYLSLMKQQGRENRNEIGEIVVELVNRPSVRR